MNEKLKKFASIVARAFNLLVLALRQGFCPHIHATLTLPVAMKSPHSANALWLTKARCDNCDRRIIVAARFRRPGE